MDGSDDRGRRRRGWLLVIAQLVLVAGCVVLPGAALWSAPQVVRGVALVLALASLGWAAVALVGLGPSLTASPVPRDAGRLRTSGPQGWVRHPVYLGLLVGVGAFAWASGVPARIGCWLLLAVLLDTKARWEESMLLERFPDYAEYRLTTRRWLPRPPRHR